MGWKPPLFAGRAVFDARSLRLSIIKNYVKSLKGRIRVKSVEGEGFSFFMIIPVESIKK